MRSSSPLTTLSQRHFKNQTVEMCFTFLAVDDRSDKEQSEQVMFGPDIQGSS
jgi:hypothetical protein